jgi:hypothetical protein
LRIRRKDIKGIDKKGRKIKKYNIKEKEVKWVSKIWKD